MSVGCNLLVEDILHGKIQVEPCPIPLNSLENVMLNSISRKTGVFTLKSRYEQIGEKNPLEFFSVLELSNSFDHHCWSKSNYILKIPGQHQAAACPKPDISQGKKNILDTWRYEKMKKSWNNLKPSQINLTFSKHI